MITYAELDVLLAEHQINLYRHDAYVRSVVNKRLTAAQKQLVMALAGKDLAKLNKRDLSALLADINQIINDNYQSISSYLANGFNGLYAVQVASTAAIYNKWLQADVFATLPRYKLEAIKYTPLVENMPFNKWWDRQAESVKFKFEQAVRQGMILGESEYDISKEVRDIIDGSMRQAKTLVRTASADVANKAQEHLFQINKDVIKGQQQLSTLDGRTTPDCRARDLLMWDLDGNPVGHDFPFRMPPLHFNCRSFMRAVMDFNADLFKRGGKRASEFGPVSDTVDYEKFLKGQSAEYQNRVLGKRKAQWFREGRIGMKDMVNQDGRPLTLDQLKARYSL